MIGQGKGVVKMRRGRTALQPWIHDKKVLVNAPAQLWCRADGKIGRGYLGGALEGAESQQEVDGFYVGDRRIVSSLGILVDGMEAVPISWRSERHDVSFSSSVARNIDGPTVDPWVRLDEVRRVENCGFTDEITVLNGLDQDVSLDVTIGLSTDMATIQEVKGGTSSAAASRNDTMTAVCDPSEACLRVDCGCTHGSVTPLGHQVPCRVEVQGLFFRMIWRLDLPARGSVVIGIRVEVSDQGQRVIPVSSVCPWGGVKVRAADSRLETWLRVSLDDLVGLRMSVPEMPDDEFLAAGAPWFFTLFGRDSLWAARFLLPLTTRPAMGTLRTLARFQASRSDAATDADPGKMPHELRAWRSEATGAFSNSGMNLPPLYYGTIDATPLWVITLAEALQYGAPAKQVAALMPQVEGALLWMVQWGDADGDGFLEYADRTGRGLSNQGWKDSGDSIRWGDGSLAVGPLALCEVQGYAYQAAMAGAGLLDRFHWSGGDRWRVWANDLKKRFNERFWVDNGSGPFPAVALDGYKRPVDSVTSNMGHLLGTGILEPSGVEQVVARIMRNDMFSGYGIRTLSRGNGGYWPLSYHCGSVWTHDNAIILQGLAREGRSDAAIRLAEGLVKAAEVFDYHIPELFSGDSGPGGPVAYPAACHPQAWAAASSVEVLAFLLGMDPEAPEKPINCDLSRGLEVDFGD